MRCTSAAHAKGRKAHPQRRPRPGTRIGDVYDSFMANKGVPIEITFRGSVQLYYLTDFYGLDIRKVHNGLWVLAGEWFGRAYVDYIAEVLEEDDAPVLRPEGQDRSPSR